MKKIIKFFSFFILNSQKRKEFRKKHNYSYLKFALGRKKYKIKGANNKVIVVENGYERILSKYWIIKGLNIELTGDNNVVRIEFPIYRLTNCNFSLLGNNNVISIKTSKFNIDNFKIGSHWGNNRTISIDEDFSTAGLRVWIEDNDSSITIGKDCMFSHDLFFRNCDGHCILDKKGNVINKADKTTIGNHVWIGAFVKVLKNVSIPDGCIIGCGSIVNKKFIKQNCVIAGSPAKVVKEDISWIRENFNNYSERVINETTA